eukprot:GHUV01002244.1.p2 GENE.GHUV01002244.1~~GHUV01002244.1.p2  ORF type:complete len:114 (-),score=3.33 GHUV01002244.1:91-432(-)
MTLSWGGWLWGSNTTGTSDNCPYHALADVENVASADDVLVAIEETSETGRNRSLCCQGKPTYCKTRRGTQETQSFTLKVVLQICICRLRSSSAGKHRFAFRSQERSACSDGSL